MKMENTEDKLFDLIEQHLGTRPETAGQNLISDLGADSLDIVEITMAVEEDFNISISDDEVGGEITAQTYLDIIAAKRAAQ
jgi:acyl carrier protein